jgi:type III pantothenate kinase
LPAPARVFESATSDFDAGRLERWFEHGDTAAAAADWLIASVNRPPTDLLTHWLEHRGLKEGKTGAGPSHDTIAYFHLLTYRDLPLAIQLAEPGRVGIDRLLGAVAANHLRSAGRRALVIDVGSAITVDLVSAAGEFLGGAILPGIAMAARAMHQFTDRLPSIAMQELAEPPPALGVGTVEAMRSGLYWGSVGAMKELIFQLTAHHSSDAGDTPEIFVTGGAAPIVASYLDPQARCVDHLILSGIVLSAE